jgi:hypothetical protein
LQEPIVLRKGNFDVSTSAVRRPGNLAVLTQHINSLGRLVGERGGRRSSSKCSNSLALSTESQGALQIYTGDIYMHAGKLGVISWMRGYRRSPNMRFCCDSEAAARAEACTVSGSCPADSTCLKSLTPKEASRSPKVLKMKSHARRHLMTLLHMCRLLRMR